MNVYEITYRLSQYQPFKDMEVFVDGEAVLTVTEIGCEIAYKIKSISIQSSSNRQTMIEIADNHDLFVPLSDAIEDDATGLIQEWVENEIAERKEIAHYNAMEDRRHDR